MPFRDRHMTCPACSDALGERTILGGAQALHCERCEGMFIDHDVVRRLTRALSRIEAASSVDEGHEPARRCPHCDRVLAAAEIGGVTVDFCARHGVWFDTAELARLSILGDIE